MRARFYDDGYGRVIARFTDHLGHERHEVYTCRSGGGYVRDEVGRHVCEELASSGTTLYCEEGASLLSMIRREYRAMKRRARREERAWLGGRA